MAEQGLVFAGDRGVAPGGQSALLSSDTPLTLSGGLMAARTLYTPGHGHNSANSQKGFIQEKM